MNIINKLKQDVYPSKDYIFNSIFINDIKVYYIYNESLCDIYKVNDLILKKLLNLEKDKLYSLNMSIANTNVLVLDEKDILLYLNNGYFIIITNKIYAFEMRSNLSRGVCVADELSINGPKDSFCEIFQINIGLIRKRIKSAHLKVDSLCIGKYTNTSVGILYIDTIAKIDLINKIKSKLLSIDIDGIIESSYLKEILENKYNSFPTISITERPDKCSMALLEGRVVLISDNSPHALILPYFFNDLFHTTDDYYQKSFNTSFIRIIRFIAFLISIYIPAIYIAATTRNYYIVPYNLLLVLKAGRDFVPFPAYLEALFMIICFEILKECDLRMSKTSASSISILGGLILGDAAVSAGIVSPIMIIVIAISSISGLIFSSLDLANALRTYKLLLLFLSSFFGLNGIIFGTIILFYDLLTTKVFNYSYLNIDKSVFFDWLFKFNTNIRFRNSELTDNIVRGKIK